MQTAPHFRAARLGALLLTITTVCLALPSLGTPAGAEVGDPATGSSVELPDDAVVRYVDTGAAERVWPHTDVWPDGSRDFPYPSITWGVGEAQKLRSSGSAVHLLVAPGVYRETVSVSSAGDAPKPLVIEAEVPGSVIVSGADVEQRWTPIAGTAQLWSPWVQNWGLSPIPSGQTSSSTPYLIRRRETMLVDGKPLAQVANRSALTPGTFVVDESANQIIAVPPTGMTDFAGHLVEVAQRERALEIKVAARAVAVKGFVFEAAAPGLAKFMVYVSDSANILIEGNTFRYSSWGGLGFCCTDAVTVRGNLAIDNGGNGIDTYKVLNAVIEDNYIARNNVRGFQSGYVGWSTAGSKHFRLQDAVLRGNTYEGNLARGLWFDTSVKNILIDGDRSCGSVGDGVFLEASQGPFTIQDASFCDNGGAGIAVSTTGNVRVERSTLSNNVYGQLVFTGVRSRTWTDHITNKSITMGFFDNWTLMDNTLSSPGSASLIYSPVIPIADWKKMLGAHEIVAARNVWSRPSMVYAIKIQATDYTMAEWQAATGDSEPVAATKLLGK
ncbi:MAG: right-handed parallel beta-helix repeat-containing protein [Acidimicrobiales bacterium]